MDPVTGAVLLIVLAGVLVALFLSEKEKSAVRRMKRRKFKPQWTRRDGDTRRRRKRY